MDDYSTEPILNFKPLCTSRYSEFYSLEMDGDNQDCAFYLSRCKAGRSILELGCGTGRISQLLSNSGLQVTGLDISPEMINKAMQKECKARFVEADMRNFYLVERFSHILVPYNTLNLLDNEIDIASCLNTIAAHLEDEGCMLLQLFIPSKHLVQKDGERSFQFKLIPLPQNGKLVKETIRSFHAEENRTILEERYRFRPSKDMTEWEDLSHTLTLYTPQLSWWRKQLERSGFTDLQWFSAPQGGAYDSKSDNLVFVAASK